MKLTQKNYYTNKNKYLTNSKITWYLKDPATFKKFFILGKREHELSDAMILGGAFDVLATQGRKKFNKLYHVVDRRSKDDPNYDYTLNRSMADQIEGMFLSLKRQKAYIDLKKYKTQVILQEEWDLNHFQGLAGMLDFLHVDHVAKKAIIVDLKTSNNLNPNTYHYKCEDMGYYRQMAMYKRLVRKQPNQGDYWVICRHLVIDKDSDGINRVYTFEFDDDNINYHMRQIHDIAEEIKNTPRDKFLPWNSSWDEPIII